MTSWIIDFFIRIRLIYRAGTSVYFGRFWQMYMTWVEELSSAVSLFPSREKSNKNIWMKEKNIAVGIFIVWCQVEDGWLRFSTVVVKKYRFQMSAERQMSVCSQMSWTTKKKSTGVWLRTATVFYTEFFFFIPIYRMNFIINWKRLTTTFLFCTQPGWTNRSSEAGERSKPQLKTIKLILMRISSVVITVNWFPLISLIRLLLAPLNQKCRITR